MARKKARVCPVCETETPEGAVSCGYCKRVFLPGDFEEKTAPEGPPEPEAPLAKPKQGLKPYVYTAVGAAALVAGLLLSNETKVIIKEGNDRIEAATPPPAPPAAPAPDPAAPPTPAPPPPPPPPKAADGTQVPRGAQSWTLEGKVFDPSTRKPFADVELVFTDRDTKERYAARADAKGRYRARLAWTSAGYGLQLWEGGRRLNFMEDWIPSLLGLPEDKAKEAAEELKGRPPTLEDVFGTPGGTERKTWAAVALTGRK